MTADEFAASVTANTRRELGIVATEHQHLLRANIGFYCAYGHDWRAEKAQYDRDPNAGLIEE
jgi:hypothetical protein